MSLQVEKLEHNMAKLTIEVPVEEFDKAIEASYQKNKNRINVPGFRKGKAPRKLIEQMYGKGVFLEDAVNELVPASYDKEVAETDLVITSAPKFDLVDMEPGQPLVFTAEVALKPEVKLGTYSGVKVAKADLDVTDEEVTAEIDKEREKNSRTVDVTDRAVANGDIATIDFEGFVDGVAFEGGKGEEYPLTIGSGAFIPGFEEALVGAEIGVETDVNVTFPEEYQAEELAGKAAVFKCTVKKLQEKVLPELDDDFVSEISESSDTVDEYKEEVKATIADRKAKAAKEAKEDSAIDAVIAEAEMDIPDAMVETQARQMLDDYAQRLQMQGLSIEQYMQFTGMTAQNLLEQFKPMALKRIQSRLVLEAVAEAADIQASDEDYEEEVKVMAETYQMTEEQVKNALAVNGKDQVMEDIRVKKAVAFVVDNAVEE